MKLHLNEHWDTFDVFCLLESVARDVSMDAVMTVYEENDDITEHVSLGLDAELYAAAYQITSCTDISVSYPDGKSVFYTHWLPGELTLEGSEGFVRAVEARIASFVPKMMIGNRPYTFAQTDKLLALSVNDRLRRFHRAASSTGSSMYLADRHRNGKLVRITASWMLDVYENPIDVLIRFPNDGWFVFHNASGVSYASSNCFSEAQALLNIVQ